MNIDQLMQALGLQRAYQAYQQNIGEPFAAIAGGMGRGYLGLDKPQYGGLLAEDMYKIGQAAGNSPIGIPAGAFKAAAQVPELLGLAASITPRAASKIAEAIAGQQIRTFGSKGFDVRFDPRVTEQERLAKLKTSVDVKQNVEDVPSFNLAKYEGYPFITSMSDRSAAGGLLTSINDVLLKRPVELQGGQDFMFANPMAWASAKQPVNQILENARVLKEVTGKDPFFIPWRMAPTGGDFATMTGEAMISFAESAFGKTQKKSIDKAIKEIIPNWPGLDSVNSIDVYRKTPDKKRKEIQQMLDVKFREEGGLGRGEARLSVTDPKQLQGFDTQIMNVGRIFADQPMIQQSGHASYPFGVPGEGVGRVQNEIGIFQLLPNVVAARGIQNPLRPSPQDVRALQMKPYAGILTENVLRQLGY